MRPSSSIDARNSTPKPGPERKSTSTSTTKSGVGRHVGERPALVGPAHHERALAAHLDQRQRVAELPVGTGDDELVVDGLRFGLGHVGVDRSSTASPVSTSGSEVSTIQSASPRCRRRRSVSTSTASLDRSSTVASTGSRSTVARRRRVVGPPARWRDVRRAGFGSRVRRRLAGWSSGATNASSTVPASTSSTASNVASEAGDHVSPGRRRVDDVRAESAVVSESTPSTSVVSSSVEVGRLEVGRLDVGRRRTRWSRSATRCPRRRARPRPRWPAWRTRRRPNPIRAASRCRSCPSRRRSRCRPRPGRVGGPTRPGRPARAATRRPPTG